MVMTVNTNGSVPGLYEAVENLGYPGSPPPNIADVLALFQSSRQYYESFRKQCSDAETYYFGLNEIPVVPGFDPVRPATAWSIINTATDHVDVTNLTIEVMAASVRAKARAEKLKKFYLGVWAAIKEPVLRTAVRQTFLYGISFLKPMFVPDMWPDPPNLDDYATDAEFKEALMDFQDRRNISFPITVKNVNPKQVVWDDSRLGRRWAIEYYDREARDIARRYPHFVGKSKSGLISWMEYWDEEWYGYIADNEWVEGPHRHYYGFLPYIPIHLSNSVEHDSGLLTRRYRGLLTPVLNLLDSEARLASQYEAIIRQFAWQTLNFRGPAQAAERARQDYEFMGKNYIPPSVEVEAGPRTPPPPELLQQLNIVQTLIEEATYPNVVRGIRPKGVSSGFGVSVLAGMGRMVFQGAADGLARAIEQCNSGFAQLVENKIRGSITVHARSEAHNFDQTVAPDDIRGFIENSVKLKAEAPEEREREALLGMRLHQQGVISLYEAQRRAGITNPLEEQLQQSAEKLLAAPEMIQAQAQMVMERVGLLQQLAQVAGGPEGGGLGGPEAGQFLPGMGQGPRLGEAGIQRQRMASQAASQAQPGAYPQGMGGMDAMASLMAGAPGGAVNLPSGQRLS